MLTSAEMVETLAINPEDKSMADCVSLNSASLFSSSMCKGDVPVISLDPVEPIPYLLREQVAACFTSGLLA